MFRCRHQQLLYPITFISSCQALFLFFSWHSISVCETEKMGFEPMRRYQRPTPFPGEPLQPLGYFSNCWFLQNIQFYKFSSKITTISTRKTSCPISLQEKRRGWDSNPRFLSESLVFKTSSLNRSDTSPNLLSIRCYLSPSAQELV